VVKYTFELIKMQFSTSHLFKNPSPTIHQIVVVLYAVTSSASEDNMIAEVLSFQICIKIKGTHHKCTGVWWQKLLKNISVFNYSNKYFSKINSNFFISQLSLTLNTAHLMLQKMKP
jgi:hypothetical protein